MNALSNTEVINDILEAFIQGFRLLHKYITSSNVLQTYESNSLECIPQANAKLKDLKKKYNKPPYLLAF